MTEKKRGKSSKKKKRYQAPEIYSLDLKNTRIDALGWEVDGPWADTTPTSGPTTVL